MTDSSPDPRTTFVIASRDRSAELATVLHRLLDSTRCPVILVDNASRDDSVEVARRIAAGSGERLTVVELDENLGAVGRNVGVARAHTPFVAFCDDDSWWDPNSVALAERLFDEYPTLGLLAARTVVWPDGRDDPIVADLANSPLGHDPALPGPSVLGFLSCSAIVRKDAFEAVHGFSPILHFRGEEQLLAWDLAAAGWALCFCARLTAFHQPSAQRATTAVQDARLARNAALTTWLRRPLRPCLDAAAALLRAAVRDHEHARAFGQAMWSLPAVFAERRRLPIAVEQAVRRCEGC
ncbi:MAG: glycosyltransferase family 2 protein [Mycobacterium sp.]|nr:glycosyltransferase family 2 protein [Mycobacterium sp.]